MVTSHGVPTYIAQAIIIHYIRKTRFREEAVYQFIYQYITLYIVYFYVKFFNIAIR